MESSNTIEASASLRVPSEKLSLKEANRCSIERTPFKGGHFCDAVYEFQFLFGKLSKILMIEH